MYKFRKIVKEWTKVTFKSDNGNNCGELIDELGNKFPGKWHLELTEKGNLVAFQNGYPEWYLSRNFVHVYNVVNRRGNELKAKEVMANED